MQTKEFLTALRAGGKRPQSLWVNEHKQVELQFEDEMLVLCDAAAGNRMFNTQLDGNYKAAIGNLARVAVECRWETDRKDAAKFLSQYELVEGTRTRIYPT